jgi:hypothetical protein
MSIKFACAKCGHHLKADTDLAGKHCKCTRCGHTMTVPAPESLPEPPVAAPAASPAGPVNRKSKRRLPLGAGFATVVLVGGVLLAISFYARTHEVDRKLADLGGDAPEVRIQALLWLAEAAPQDSRRAQVTAALEPLIFEGDVRGTLDPDVALRAYLHWANQVNAPSMIRMVENPNLPTWSTAKTGQVMIALGKLQDKRAAEALARKLPDPKLHDHAVDALKLLGPGGEDAVMPFLFIGDPPTQQRAGELLAVYGTSPNTVFGEARRRLQSNDQEERQSAAVWFTDNSSDNDAEKGEVTGPLAALLGDLSPRVNHLGLKALKLWGTKDCLPQVVAFAGRQEKAGNSKEAAANASAVIDLLAQFPDESAADAVALWLKDPEQRDQAVQALVKIGPPATEPVLRHLNYPDPAVQKEARSLCNRLKVSTERQLGQTLADIADARKPRSRAALQHLAQLRPDGASRLKVSQALNAPLLDTDAEIREGALDAARVWATRENTDTLLKLLGNLAGERKQDSARTIDRVSQVLIAIGPEVQEAVIPLLKSPLVPVRGQACRILGEVGTNKSVPALPDAGNAWLAVDPDSSNFTQLSIAKIEARK